MSDEKCIKVWKMTSGDHAIYPDAYDEYGRFFFYDLALDDVEWIVYVSPPLVPPSWRAAFETARAEMAEYNRTATWGGYDEPLRPTISANAITFPDFWGWLKMMLRFGTETMHLTDEGGVVWTIQH